MAIIPPEFFGLFGLGQSISNAAGDYSQFGQIKEQKQFRSDEIKKRDTQQALENKRNAKNDLWMEMDRRLRLYPNRPSIAFQFGLENGLLSEKDRAVPEYRELMAIEGLNPDTGFSKEQMIAMAGNQVTTSGQSAIIGQQTIDLNKHRLEEIDVIKKAKTERDNYLRSQGLLKEGETADGTVEGMKIIQSLRQGAANLEQTKGQTKLLGLNIRRAERELEELKKQADPNVKYWEKMFEATLLPPSLIKEAMSTPAEQRTESQQYVYNEVNKAAGSLRERMRIDLRNARTGEAAKFAENLSSIAAWSPNSVPDSLKESAINDWFASAGYVKGPDEPVGFWRSLFGGESPTTWVKKDFVTEVGQMTGEGTKAGETSNPQVQAYSDQLLGRANGDKTTALKIVEDNKAKLGSNYEAIKRNIEATGITPATTPVKTEGTPTPDTTPKTETVTPGSNPSVRTAFVEFKNAKKELADTTRLLEARERLLARVSTRNDSAEMARVQKEIDGFKQQKDLLVRKMTDIANKHPGLRLEENIPK